MSAEKIVLAFDLGTTGNRVVAFSSKGELLASSYQEFTQYFPKAGWVEHDPMEIWKSTLSVFKRLCEKIDVNQIVAAGITNQRETVMIWEKDSGNPVYNAIVWQCRRTADICNNLKSEEEQIRQRTGLPLDPYFSGTKIKWLLDNVPGAKQKALDGNLLCGTVDSWLVWKLTRGKSHVTDVSNASRSLCLNIHNLKYDAYLLDLWGAPLHMLPEVKKSGDEFGIISKDWVGKEIPIIAVLGDQQAALFGQWSGNLNVVKNTYGTGLFLMTPSQKAIVPEGGLLGTVGWSYNNQTMYALEGSVFTGGSVIQWLRDNLKILASAEESEQMALSVSDSDGVYFVPALTGLGVPYWDSSARGMLIGITRGTNVNHIARSALEALAYQVKDVVDLMNQQLPQKISCLKVDGGACKNNFLMQFQSDMLGVKVERPKNIETTAWGVAGLAGIMANVWSEKEFYQLQTTDKNFEPSLDPAKANKMYAKWKDAVTRCLKWDDES